MGGAAAGPRPPPARRRADCFRSAMVSGGGGPSGRLRWRLREVATVCPRALAPGHFAWHRKISPAAALDDWEGMAWHVLSEDRPECGNRGGVCRHLDDTSLAAVAVRRDRGVFLGKNSSFWLGFPGRGLGFRKTKPTSGREVGFGYSVSCSSVVPLPVRCCAAFRGGYLVCLPGGESLQTHAGLHASLMGGLSGNCVRCAVHGSE
jgi:hypothetical protein